METSPAAEAPHRLARAALPQTPKRTPTTTGSTRRPRVPESMCARSLETTTKFASVLLHATHRPSPPLETARGVVKFWVGTIRPATRALSSQTCAEAVSHAQPVWSTPIDAQRHPGRHGLGWENPPTALRLPDLRGECQRHSHVQAARSVTNAPNQRGPSELPQRHLLCDRVNSLPNPRSVLQWLKQSFIPAILV